MSDPHHKPSRTMQVFRGLVLAGVAAFGFSQVIQAMTASSTNQELTRHVHDLGLTGWTAVGRGHSELMGRRVVVLTSPDYNPETQAGTIIAGYGADDADAMAKAVEMAFRHTPAANRLAI